jgi:tetratricopeptide (TPR) repeat protein
MRYRGVHFSERGFILLGLTLLLSACAGRIPDIPATETLNHLSSPVVIDVPFHAQDAYQCGPASLAMMLNHRGTDDSPDALRDRVYIPERRGTLQVEMVSAARERDLLVYPITRNLEALLTELDAGNPVLVMQNLSYRWAPRWHYAVAIGYDLERREVILHSGTERARRKPFKVFVRTWNRAELWGRVILPPGELPATAEPLTYLRAASDLEQTGRLDSAKRAYEAALERWPQQAAARFGLGNIAWAQNRPDESVEHFRLVVTEFPDIKPAWHNLGVGLKALGCAEAARQASNCAKGIPSSGELSDQLHCVIPSCF